MKVKHHKELIVWQKSMQLAKMIYILTSKFPTEEKYGFCSQMQGCSVAIPSDIAEGAKRSYTREYIQMLSKANGSAAELETQLLLSQEIYSYLKIDEEFEACLALTDEVLKMLYRLIESLNSDL